MWAPLGVLYLASYTRKLLPDVLVKVTDGCRIGYHRTWQEIQRFRPDVLGISFLTTQAQGAYALSREVKQRLPGTLVVLGGPHVTALPQETLRESSADIAVIGEGEEVFYRIVASRRAREPLAALYSQPGVWVADDRLGSHRVHRNAPMQFITPLDSLPFPAWDLIDLRSYRGWVFSKASPEAPLVSSRGCPYCCTFCSNAVWKSSRPAVRFRSASNVADEMQYLHEQFGVREFFDNADEFNCSLAQALDLCREIRRRHMNVTWKCQLRVKPFTEELAKAMKEAGCWYVHLGIETGNQETIDGIGKRIQLSDVEETCCMLKKNGICVLGLFMLYNAWEEDGDLRFEDSARSLRTIQFAEKLFKRRLLDYISCSITAPFPGSRLFDIAVRHQLIRPYLLKNWEAWQKQELFILSLPGVPVSEQKRMKRKGEWLRLRCVLRNRNFRLKDVLFLTKRALHLLAKCASWQTATQFPTK